jgi:hypothetical protein
MSWLRVGGLLLYKVSVLGIDCRGLGNKCWRSVIVGRCRLKVDVEGTSVFQMGWGREKFC